MLEVGPAPAAAAVAIAGKKKREDSQLKSQGDLLQNHLPNAAASAATEVGLSFDMKKNYQSEVC